MSLLPCKECGKRISDKAPMCTHCGVTITGSQRSQIEGMDAVLLLISCMAGLFLGLFLAGFVDGENTGLKVSVGLSGLVIPPIAFLVWSSRRK